MRCSWSGPSTARSRSNRTMAAGLRAMRKHWNTHRRLRSARQPSTLPMSGMWSAPGATARLLGHPPDERGGNRQTGPTATAPPLDSTGLDHSQTGVDAGERTLRMSKRRLPGGSGSCGPRATANGVSLGGQEYLVRCAHRRGSLACRLQDTSFGGHAGRPGHRSKVDDSESIRVIVNCPRFNSASHHRFADRQLGGDDFGSANV
jgi:hypothetical protein